MGPSQTSRGQARGRIGTCMDFCKATYTSIPAAHTANVSSPFSTAPDLPQHTCLGETASGTELHLPSRPVLHPITRCTSDNGHSSQKPLLKYETTSTALLIAQRSGETFRRRIRKCHTQTHGGRPDCTVQSLPPPLEIVRLHRQSLTRKHSTCPCRPSNWFTCSCCQVR